jgi:hypothetical protein
MYEVKLPLTPPINETPGAAATLATINAGRERATTLPASLQPVNRQQARHIDREGCP